MNEIHYPCDTKQGFMAAYEGDGLVMQRPEKARGTVQRQTSPTLLCGRGGGAGVVVKNTKTQWFNGAKKGGLEECEVGDGLKIYPNPARYNSGETVQKQKSNALNTYRGCGSGTVDGDLRIRYLTPRECLRLMGFDDGQIDKLMEAVPSKTNLYKLAGNSIVVNVLEAIFKAIYIDGSFNGDKSRQKSLVDYQAPINPIVGRRPEEIERKTLEMEGIGQ